MSVRLYADSTRVAIYEEAAGGGNPIDPNSLMNRPVITPMSWLANIKFHSDLNYYGIAAKNLSATVAHPSVAGKTIPLSGAITFLGDMKSATHVLLNHSLGYVPKFFVIYNNRLIPNAIPVQSLSDGRCRFISSYATTSQIVLYEMGVSSASALPAISLTYQVIVFRDSAKDPLLPYFEVEPGNVVFGQGKFRGNEAQLRVNGAGDIAWPMALGPTAAVRNGGIRSYSAAGSFSDYSSYNGSFTGPSFLNLAAGV